MNRIQKFVSKKLAVYSECPVCHSSPCKCNGLATHSEEDKLPAIKAKLIECIKEVTTAEDDIEAITKSIMESNRGDLLDMIVAEMSNIATDQGAVYENYLAKLKGIKSELEAYCGDASKKTYSSDIFNKAVDVLEAHNCSECEASGTETEFKVRCKCAKSASELEKELIDTIPSYEAKVNASTSDEGVVNIHFTKVGTPGTYSVMSEYDVDLRKEAKDIISRAGGVSEDLPEPKETESGADFYKRCMKWADKVSMDPESSTYKDLVNLGKKYKLATYAEK